MATAKQMTGIAPLRMRPRCCRPRPGSARRPMTCCDASTAPRRAVGAYDEVMHNSFTPPFYETRMHNAVIAREPFERDPWASMTRQHLYDALLGQARGLDIEILHDSEAVSATLDGTVTLASGKT